jgi:hypothetical protein
MLNRWEDGFIVESMDCPPERLFRPDIAIVAWRRWCDQQARAAPGTGSGSAAESASSARPGAAQPERSSVAADLEKVKLPEHEPT